MGTIKLNSVSEPNEEKNSNLAVTAASGTQALQKGTVVITHVPINTDGMFEFTTVEDSDDCSDDFYGELRVEQVLYDTIYSTWAHINMRTEKIPQGDEIKGIVLELTAKPGAEGRFRFGMDYYDAIPNKKYRFDITEKTKTKPTVRFELNPGDSCDLEFYTTGEHAPKVYAVMETERPEVKEEKCKKIELCEAVECNVNLYSGKILTAITALSDKNYLTPLNLKHLYVADGVSGVCGQNWRLNFDKKLKTVKNDLSNDREFQFIDEFGKAHDFKESYYYYENGKRISVGKNSVTVDLNGNIWYFGKKAYKRQSCGDYTLIPEISEFINAEFLEQRQAERVQIESYVNQLAPNLKTYCVVNTLTGEILKKFNELTKKEYDDILYALINNINNALMPQSEALQLKVLYENQKQNKQQKEQLELSKTEYEMQVVLLNEKIKDLASNNKQTEIDDTDEQIQLLRKKITNLNTQLSLNDNQWHLIFSQIDYLIKQAKANVENVKETFRLYFSKEAELATFIKHTPVNFLKDENGVISGFNAEGTLVYLCDADGNYAAVQYDVEGKITELFDSKKAILNFDYSDGKLKSVTDECGKTVSYEYNANRLSSITYPDGGKVEIAYAFNRISSIATDDFQYKFSFDEYGKIKTVTTNSKLLTIPAQSTDDEAGFNKTLAQIEVAYDGATTILTDKSSNKETYSFGENGKLTEYKFERNDGFVTLTKYDEFEAIDGKTRVEEKSNNFNDTVVKTTEKYDDIDLLVSRETDWQRISETLRTKTLTEYEYDLNANLIKERATQTLKDDGIDKTVISVVKYGYDTQGRLVLKESFIEGEELTSGVNFEKRIYDDDSRVIKTVSWNSLDASTKFYAETAYGENGLISAEKDGLGETTAEYEYLDGTNEINAVKYPNGGKLAYGRNPYNGELTSVTQSTSDGEANTTDIRYEHGLPVEVKSGNTVINYSYDYARRKSEIKVNGVSQGLYFYRDYVYNAQRDSCIYAETVYNLDNKSTFCSHLKTGVKDAETGVMKNTESLKINGSEILRKDYDLKGRLRKVTDSVSGVSEFTYDGYDRLKQVFCTKGTDVQIEDFNYNSFGDVVIRTVKASGLAQAYGYEYKDNAARSLVSVNYGNYKFKLLTDVYGRSCGKEISQGAAKISAEYISYKKIGDRATNLPATVWYANGAIVKDNLKYKYDNCGNIVEITANNKLQVKYFYDELNRLVKEDNKALRKVTEIVYDNNGNILNKYITANGVTTTDEYLYDRDRLKIYNGERCLYGILGNPTIYRNKSLGWEHGKRLIRVGDISFAYDGSGRRVSKNGVNYAYDNDGRLISFGTLQFIYDNAGVIGIICDEKTYFYRKDIQGNIIAILNESGTVVANYIYDAWGNHAIVDNDGNDIEDTQHIGNINPFRYRSYYYDIETGLYYLQTRYYDPETGRFISQDSLDYADPETVNGLNLYAYCGNNPVMGYDPTGMWDWGLFWKGLGLVFTAVVAVVISVATFGAGTPLGISMVAGATLAAGVLTGINGIATVVEAGVGYNFVRDGIFQGNETAYNWYAGITEGVAAVGTMILGVYNMTGRAQAARYGRNFLGKGYSKVGTNRWVSKDGLRQMMFDNTHHMLDGVRTSNHFNLYTHFSDIRMGRSNIINKIHAFYRLFKVWFR